jgi:MFS family permease
MVDADRSDRAPTAQRSGLIVTVLGLLAAIQIADPFISSVALVRASDGLDFTAAQQSLAAGISTFALAATVVFGGVLADRLGRKHVLVLSILVSSAGQLITAMSPEPTVYFVGRVITGIALGATFAAAFGMVRDVVPEAERGPALAKFTIVGTIGPLALMMIAGPIAQWDWRIAYLMLPVLSGLLFPFALKILPRVPVVAGTRFNVVANILIAVGVFGLLLGVSHAGVGLHSPQFFVPVAIGVVAITAFAIATARSAHPVFPLRLLAHPAFLAAVIAGIGFNLGGAGLSIMTSNIWQYVVHMPTSLVGIAGAPSAVTAILASLITGRLIKRGVPSSVLLASGLLVFVLAYLAMLPIDAGSPYALYLPAVLLSGAATAITSVVQGGLFLRLAPAPYFGPVTSSRTMYGQFGYALGLTGTTMLVNSFTEHRVDLGTAGAVVGESNWDAITTFMMSGQTSVAALQTMGQPAVLQAYAGAVVRTSIILAVVALVMVLVVFVLLRTRAAAVPMDAFLGIDGSAAATSSTPPTDPAHERSNTEKDSTHG